MQKKELLEGISELFTQVGKKAGETKTRMILCAVVLQEQDGEDETTTLVNVSSACSPHDVVFSIGAIARHLASK